MQDFYNLTRADLEARLTAAGHPAMHARDLFRRAFRPGHAGAPWEAPGLPRAVAGGYGAMFSLSRPEIETARLSRYDQSVKMVMTLADGARVESVLMPEKSRITLCVSSQVGCAQGCVFCHTGRMGLGRDLTAGEIVGQILAANAWIRAHPDWPAGAGTAPGPAVSNVVFMGMGEPLDNVAQVARAWRIMTDPYGLALGPGRISVSTAGHLEGIEAVVRELPNVRLALSVHTTDPAQRSRLMPINRRWPLATVIARLRELQAAGLPGVLLQFTLIRGVNDHLDEAHRLAGLAAGLDAKVNLIPFNEVEPSRFTAPAPETVQAFRDVLHRAGLRVLVRYSKGQDIGAACGQLVQQPTRA